VIKTVQAVAPSVLKKGLVVTVDTVQISGKKLVLELPSVGYEARFSTADVRAMPADQFAAFAAEFRNQFNEPFAVARRMWFADIRKVVRLAEGEVRTAGQYADDTASAVRDMHPIVDRANEELRAKCAAYADALRQLSDTAYRAALQKSYRAVKRQPVPSKVRVDAEFELVKPIPPARPNVAVSRLVTMPTTRR
jgi:hypothetical protein